MKQADMWVCTHDFFAIELEDKSEHAVGGRMLGSKVNGVVPDFAVFGVGAIVGGEIHALGIILIYRVTKVWVDWYETSTSARILRRFGEVAWERGRQRTGELA